MIGHVFREYRKSKGISLKELVGEKYKTFHSFEDGRSTNYRNITPYLELSKLYNEEYLLLEKILLVLTEESD